MASSEDSTLAFCHRCSRLFVIRDDFRDPHRFRVHLRDQDVRVFTFRERRGELASRRGDWVCSNCRRPETVVSSERDLRIPCGVLVVRPTARSKRSTLPPSGRSRGPPTLITLRVGWCPRDTLCVSGLTDLPSIGRVRLPYRHQVIACGVGKVDQLGACPKDMSWRATEVADNRRPE